MEEKQFIVTTAIKKIRRLKKRKKILQGGTSASKTFGTLAILIDTALRYPNLEISVVSETLPHLKKGAMRDFIKILVMTRRYNEAWFNKTDLIYKLPNGSYIEFFSADQSDKVRGPRRDILYVNEVNRINLETFTQLVIRTSGDIYADFNPSQRFWMHEEIENDPDMDFLVLDYTDNEALSDEIIKELLNNKSKAFYDINSENLYAEENIRNEYWANWWRVYGEGQVGQLEGIVFSNWERGEFDESLPYIWGQDYGFSKDPDTLIKVAKRGKRLFVKEYMYESSQSTDQLISRMNEIITNKNDLIVGDAAESRTIKDLQLAGFNAYKAKKGPDSIRNGIKNLQNYQIIVDPDSKNIIDEMENYIWNDKKSETPVDAFNHCIDAIRYAEEQLASRESFFVL